MKLKLSLATFAVICFGLAIHAQKVAKKATAPVKAATHLSKPPPPPPPISSLETIPAAASASDVLNELQSPPPPPPVPAEPTAPIKTATKMKDAKPAVHPREPATLSETDTQVPPPPPPPSKRKI